jgi:2',3'-cyclic-nucleotide 2'-phosphodiesterase (5'-nucleotidase family)
MLLPFVLIGMGAAAMVSKMRAGIWAGVTGALLATTVAFTTGATAAPANQPATDKKLFEFVGRHTTGSGLGSAEIVALNGDKTRMYTTNKFLIDVVDVSNPAAPVLATQLDLTADGGEPTSVAASDDLLAVAVPAAVKTDPGKVVFFQDEVRVGEVTVGSLPDSVAFAPNGKRLVVANEGEPNSYGQPDSVDPEGSISVVDVAKAIAGQPDAVTTLGFGDFNVGGPREAEAADLRFASPAPTRAQDIEPEFVDIVNNSVARVTLQENNAVAVIDFRRPRIVDVISLGTKDHSQPGNELDASDRDRAIAITNEPVKGLYMPDGIAGFTIGGASYMVTANEGDGRDYTGFKDEARVKDLTLDATAFPNAATLQTDAELGRLTVSTADGDIDGDGEYEELYSFGARSVSIRDASGNLVWDSGSLFEQVTAAAVPGHFNASNDNNTFDDRSDNKGPEPEGVITGKVAGRRYVFVGLERVGGVVVLDATDPAAPTFVQYLNTRTFANGAVGPDSGPEGLAFVRGGESSNGKDTLYVANETSGTVSIYQRVSKVADPDGAGRLSLMHNNDGESSLTGVGVGSLLAGGAGAFKSVMDREIADARSLNNSVLSVYAGDSFLASATVACSLPPAPAGTPIYDAVAQSLMPYDVQALGNHEFDFGPDFLEEYVRQNQPTNPASKPFLAANLDFSGEPGFADLVDSDGLIKNNQTKRIIGGSSIEIDPVTGQRFGVVSAITPTLPTISSPRNVQVTTADIAETAVTVQAEIDRFETLGVRKIILVSHLQNLQNDRDLVKLLDGVDIAVAGGGDEQLGSAAIPDAREFLPGDAPAVGTYPVYETDFAGRSVPIVTTSGNYKYLGRLDVTFDAAGELASIDVNRSYPRRVVATSAATATAGVYDSVTPDPTVVSQVEAPVNACLAANNTPIASTDVRINVSRNPNASLGFTSGVRRSETNGGNLVADGYLATYDTYASANGLPARGPSNPVIAVQNGGGIRQQAGDVLPVGGVVPGDITRNNTLNVLAFLTNTMTVVSDVTPDQVKSMLERSAASLPAENGAFLQVGGFTVEYSLAGTAQVVSAALPGLSYGTVTTEGTRVRNVTLDDGTKIVEDGVVVAGAPNVRVITNSFTAAGGDNYPALGPNPAKTNLPLSYEQSLVEYLLGFPIGGSGLPTVPATDPRYSNPNGVGRIVINP